MCRPSKVCVPQLKATRAARQSYSSCMIATCECQPADHFVWYIVTFRSRQLCCLVALRSTRNHMRHPLHLAVSEAASLPDTSSARASSRPAHRPSAEVLSSRWCAATHRARGFTGALSTCSVRT